MATDIKPDAFLASLTKWGVKWRFYKDKADWLTHNRNGAGNNINATPGGFGPLRGAAAHNTASTSQTGMLTYLYTGDAARSLPGPLCNWAVLKTGEVVLMGWGTCNATGPGDPVPDSLVRKNAMPLTREHSPTTSGPSDPDAILYAPYYFGFEACYADEGPTDAQRDAMVRACVACLDVLGGPNNGYSGGSVVMHRELTTTRSDPQGWARDGAFRRAVDAMFKAGPPNTTPEAPVTLKPVTTKATAFPEAVTVHEKLTLTGSVSPVLPGVMVFDYLEPDGTTWTRFRTVAVDAKGEATATPTPGRNVTFRIGFDPQDPAYTNGNYTHVTVPVVDLPRLMFEHKQLLDRVAALEAGTQATVEP